MNHLSVLDTRTSAWREARKRWTLNSLLGREDIKSNSGQWNNVDASVFDPVLAELFYKWYLPSNGSILDPFAGGSVRGLVAESLGYDYTGIDISETQIAANRLQTSANYILGDAEAVLPELQGQYDYIFTCPPYHDLEVYTDLPNDLSNMDYSSFSQKYTSILRHSYDNLKPNRFMSIVVSEIRDYTPGIYNEGIYKNLVGLTIEAAQEAGFKYYNDYVVINAFERGAKMINRYYKTNRKVPRVHQNVLTFVKGNPDIAVLDIDNHSEIVCTIDGIPYRSYIEACQSLNIDLSLLKYRLKSTSARFSSYVNKKDGNH